MSFQPSGGTVEVTGVLKVQVKEAIVVTIFTGLQITASQ